MLSQLSFVRLWLEGALITDSLGLFAKAEAFADDPDGAPFDGQRYFSFGHLFICREQKSMF